MPILKTRKQSSRMRIVRCSGRLGGVGEGVCVCPGSVCVGGVSRGVCIPASNGADTPPTCGQIS